VAGDGYRESGKGTIVKSQHASSMHDARRGH
jgi:hypothetical protein